jgi:hypothetical protein
MSSHLHVSCLLNPFCSLCYTPLHALVPYTVRFILTPNSDNSDKRYDPLDNGSNTLVQYEQLTTVGVERPFRWFSCEMCEIGCVI